MEISTLSGKLKPNARIWKILLIISIIIIFVLPYPLNILLDDRVLFTVIIIAISAFFLFCVAVFKHINKYEVSGKLILDSNGIVILNQNNKRYFDVVAINELSLKYNGYWEQVYLIGGAPKIGTKNGNENYLSVKTVGEFSKFEILIESKAMFHKLLKYLNYYKEKGIRTTIELI